AESRPSQGGSSAPHGPIPAVALASGPNPDCTSWCARDRPRSAASPASEREGAPCRSAAAGAGGGGGALGAAEPTASAALLVERWKRSGEKPCWQVVGQIEGGVH